MRTLLTVWLLLLSCAVTAQSPLPQRYRAAGEIRWGSDAEGGEQITLQRAQNIRETREMDQARGEGRGSGRGGQRGRGQRGGEQRRDRNRQEGSRDGQRQGEKRSRSTQPRGEARQDRGHNQHPERRTEQRQDRPRRDEGRATERPHRDERGHQSEGESRFEAERRMAATRHARGDNQQKPVRPDGEHRRIDYRARAEQDGRGQAPRGRQGGGQGDGQRPHRVSKGQPRG